MGLHLLAFSQSLDSGNVPVAMNAVTDNVLGLTGGTGVIIPQKAAVLAAWAGATNMRLARLDANRFLQRGTMYLRPLTRGGATPSTSIGAGGEQNIASFLDSPPVLLENDVLRLYVQEDAAGAQQVRGLIWLAFDLKPVPPGEASVLKYTSSTPVTVADAWMSLSLTWSDIPDGVYVIVGHEHRSESNVASRLIVPGQAWRPGSPGIAAPTVTDAVGLRTHRMFYDGRMGIWGTFPGFNPPGIEVLNAATGDDEHEGFLKVIRIA